MKKLLASLLLLATAGCCIESRRIAGTEDIRVLQSGYYRVYTNGQQRVNGSYRYPVAEYRTSSYVGGPYAYSRIYPATRNVLNHASFMSYSSAASGDYMLNIINLPCYPIILIQIPIQFCLDTILIPWDLYNTPKCPEGYQERID